jgi:hypothetical protein
MLVILGSEKTPAEVLLHRRFYQKLWFLIKKEGKKKERKKERRPQ